jgi:hypothetical protein
MPVLEPELFDPGLSPAFPGNHVRMAPQRCARLYHSIAYLLPDGRVVSGGGEDMPGAGFLSKSTFEVFSPPYLYQGARPVFLTSPPPIWGGFDQHISAFDVESRNDIIDRVVLIRPASVTHGFDSDQRYIELDFSYSTLPAPNQYRIRVTSPADSKIAPRGSYMLFVVTRPNATSSHGIPSVAAWVDLQ